MKSDREEVMNGFVVVRKPSDCKKYSEAPLAIQGGQKMYSGVDRCAWDKETGDDERFHLDIYGETEFGPCSINVIRDRELIDVLVIDGIHDVLWISSCAEPSKADRFLGIDLMTSCGSALAQGIFRRLDLFADFIPLLNEHGLFPKAGDAIQNYCKHYLELEDNVEDLEKFRVLGVENMVFVYSERT